MTVAERRYTKFNPDRPERKVRTASKAAARAWLRGRPNRRVVRLHLEALGLAMRVKADLSAFAKVSKARSAILRGLSRLRAQDPELGAQFIADVRQKVIAAKTIRLELSSLGAGPKGAEAQNRFRYAAVAIVGRAKSAKKEGVAASLMLCASRVAGVRDPKPTEAAAMGVAVGLDKPATTIKAQAQMENTWEKRLGLAQPRVEQALAAGEKLLAEVGIPD
ncbi:MAG: hypothetical protein NDI82_10655 [Anaeromyxobacteraceae bacterium]|nr:hypothetical protein [Anaeromyxobacteraceae bacterium]